VGLHDEVLDVQELHDVEVEDDMDQHDGVLDDMGLGDEDQGDMVCLDS